MPRIHESAALSLITTGDNDHDCLFPIVQGSSRPICLTRMLLILTAEWFHRELVLIRRLYPLRWTCHRHKNPVECMLNREWIDQRAAQPKAPGQKWRGSCTVSDGSHLHNEFVLSTLAERLSRQRILCRHVWDGCTKICYFYDVSGDDISEKTEARQNWDQILNGLSRSAFNDTSELLRQDASNTIRIFDVCSIILKTQWWGR